MSAQDEQQMDLQLQNKVILITGGAKGIGAAVVRECAREGAIPVIADKDTLAAEQLKDELRQSCSQCEFILTELTNAQACKAAIDFTLQHFRRLDALVNNAGINENDGIGLAGGSPEQFLASLERNLFHIYNLTHFALAALKQSRGAIVNISSKTAVTLQDNASGYVAANAAILGLTREWAVELLPNNIRVNAVVPAEVMTPRYQSWLSRFPDPQAARTRVESKIPLGHRMTTPDEIARTVVFLLSEKSGHTTGQHLFVNGGYVHPDRALT